MSGIFGALNINDTDYVRLNTLGQGIVYDAVQEVVDQYNQEVAALRRIFVEGDTTDYSTRYKLPGGGYMQRLAPNSPAGAVKSVGQWDVAFPLEGFGDRLTHDRIDFAYMTVQDLDRALKTVMLQNLNTNRFEMLKALFYKSSRTFVDRVHGSLTVQPMASGDSVLYPPVVGSASEATENHYLVSGYAASSISDTNNPFKTLRDELTQHFGGNVTGGNNVAVFINSAQTAKTEALTDFDEVPDNFVRPGDNTAVPYGFPPDLAGIGRILGRVSGTWVIEWDWIPANYMLGIHLEAPRPLMRRIHPADTNLPSELTLVAESDQYPLSSSHWEIFYGYGVGNRLNGVAMELTTDGTYDTPSAYS